MSRHAAMEEKQMLLCNFEERGISYYKKFLIEGGNQQSRQFLTVSSEGYQDWSHQYLKPAHVIIPQPLPHLNLKRFQPGNGP
jgi:hypothetical protein